MTELQKALAELESRGKCTLVRIDVCDATTRKQRHTLGSAMPELVTGPECLEYTITVRIYKNDPPN